MCLSTLEELLINYCYTDVVPYRDREHQHKVFAGGAAAKAPLDGYRWGQGGGCKSWGIGAEHVQAPFSCKKDVRPSFSL